MTNAIYISTTEAYSGKSVIALGVVNLLVGKDGEDRLLQTHYQQRGL